MIETKKEHLLPPYDLSINIQNEYKYINEHRTDYRTVMEYTGKEKVKLNLTFRELDSYLRFFE